MARLGRGTQHKPRQENPIAMLTHRGGAEFSLIATDTWLIITFETIFGTMSSMVRLLYRACHRALVEHRSCILHQLIRIMEATQIVPVVVVPHHDTTLRVRPTSRPCLVEREKVEVVCNTRRAIVTVRASLVRKIEILCCGRIAVLVVATICVWMLATVVLDVLVALAGKARRCQCQATEDRFLCLFLTDLQSAEPFVFGGRRAGARFISANHERN